MNPVLTSDTALCGKIFPKLDAYLHIDSKIEYIGSSCHFRTMKRYKEYLRVFLGLPEQVKITVKRGEE